MSGMLLNIIFGPLNISWERYFIFSISQIFFGSIIVFLFYVFQLKKKYPNATITLGSITYVIYGQ